MGMRLTERDKKLLCWINAMGFVTMEQVSIKLNIAKPTAYARLRKLVAHRLLVYERWFHALPSYRVTLLGAQLSGSELSPLRRLPMATFYHDWQVTRLSLKLLERFGGHYISERQLRYEEGHPGFGHVAHLPDGVLMLDEKAIAIEVELNKKSKRRRQRIFDFYVQHFRYKEVWYFCSHTDIEHQVLPYSEKAAFFKVYALNDFIPDKESS